MDGDFFGDGAAQLVDSLKEAVVVEAGPDDSIKRLGERRMYRQLVLSLDQVAACGNEPRDSSDVWLRFSHSAIILFRTDVKTQHFSGPNFTKSNPAALMCRPFRKSSRRIQSNGHPHTLDATEIRESGSLP